MKGRELRLVAAASPLRGQMLARLACVIAVGRLQARERKIQTSASVRLRREHHCQKDAMLTLVSALEWLG